MFWPRFVKGGKRKKTPQVLAITIFRWGKRAKKKKGKSAIVLLPGLRTRKEGCPSNLGLRKKGPRKKKKKTVPRPIWRRDTREWHNQMPVLSGRGPAKGGKKQRKKGGRGALRWPCFIRARKKGGESQTVRLPLPRRTNFQKKEKELSTSFGPEGGISKGGTSLSSRAGKAAKKGRPSSNELPISNKTIKATTRER